MKIKRKLVMLLSIADCVDISSRRKVKIRKMLLLAAICLFAVNAAGQALVEHAQSRVIEPKQDVFIVPLVADIQVTDKQVRQDYGPFQFSFDKVAGLTTYEDIVSWLKASALYNANREADSDLIVAATFKITTDAKAKGYVVTVSGYPAKFVNFRSLKLDKPEDYDWISVVYPLANISDSQTAKRQAQAVSNK